MAKKSKEDIPTLEESDPKNKYKRFLAMGTVLAGQLDNVQPGDIIGVVYKGRTGAMDYHDYTVKVQKNVVTDRLNMRELLTLQAEDIRLGTAPLIGVVLDVGQITTAYGPVQSFTVSTDLDNIHPDAEEPF